MITKLATQPLCRLCTKPIAKYTDCIVLGFNASPRLHNKADCQKQTNLQVTAVVYHEPTDRFLEKTGERYVYKYYVWDGESYQDDLFCTNACAIGFARFAAGHIRTQKYVDAIGKRRRSA